MRKKRTAPEARFEWFVCGPTRGRPAICSRFFCAAAELPRSVSNQCSAVVFFLGTQRREQLSEVKYTSFRRFGASRQLKHQHRYQPMPTPIQCLVPPKHSAAAVPPAAAKNARVASSRLHACCATQRTPPAFGTVGTLHRISPAISPTCYRPALLQACLRGLPRLPLPGRQPGHCGFGASRVSATVRAQRRPLSVLPRIRLPGLRRFRGPRFQSTSLPAKHLVAFRLP